MQRLIVPLALAVSLASCSRYNPDRCAATDPKGTLLSDDTHACLRKWGEALAASPDPAEDVAEAVTVACNDVIPDGMIGDPEEGETEKETIADAFRDARREAIFWIVEERAGHCTEKN